MNRIACVCALLLAVVGLTAPAAEAQVCLDFTEFCDGLELTISGNRITGFWRNLDCAARSEPLVGIIRDGLPGPCPEGPSYKRDNPQGPAKAGIACIWDDGCEGSFEGWDWYVLLDGLDGTLDIGVDLGLGPPGACGGNQVEYEVLLGPCPFGLQSGGSSPGISLQQAIGARLEE